jgi:hypothetical protein
MFFVGAVLVYRTAPTWPVPRTGLTCDQPWTRTGEAEIGRAGQSVVVSIGATEQIADDREDQCG